jgi:hypothetical protein
MRRNILVVLGFVIINLVFLLIHRTMFQHEPFMSIISLLGHIGFLIFFPYEKSIKE